MQDCNSCHPQPVPQAENGWRQRLLAALAGMGIVLSLAASPVDAKPQPHKKAKKPVSSPQDAALDAQNAALRAAFQKRYEGLGFGHPLFLADCDTASETPKLLTDELLARFGKEIKSPKEARELSAEMAKMAREGDGAFAGGWSFLKKGGGEIDLYYAADMPNWQTPESWLAETLKATGAKLRAGALPTRGEMAPILLWHELFGHCTEESTAVLPEREEESEHRKNMCELRADIAAIVGVAHDTGSVDAMRKFVHMRAIMVFYGDADQEYNYAPQLDAVMEKIAETLGNPQKKEAFMALSDKQLLALADESHKAVAISGKEVEEALWALDDAQQARAGKLGGEPSPAARKVLARVAEAEAALLEMPALRPKNTYIPQPKPQR